MEHIEQQATMEQPWGESEIDAMLAEYLLEEPSVSNEVTMVVNGLGEVTKGSMVSPESSEDGLLPPIGDRALSPRSILPASVISSTTEVLPTLSCDAVPDPLHQLADMHSETTGSKRPREEASAGFVVDEKELADAVAKALEAHGAGQGSSKRQRVEAAAPPNVTASPVLPPVVASGQVALVPDALRTNRRKDCPEEAERRRERNRVLARKSRQKKKSMFETLQKEVTRLSHQNQIMKQIIKSKLSGFDLDNVLKTFEAPIGEISTEHMVRTLGDSAIGA